MSVLVDTSVWIDHFKNNNKTLGNLLVTDNVFCHPFIVNEIACGTPPERTLTLNWLNGLKIVRVVTNEELLKFIDMHKLYGKGCGMVDLSLLASVIINPGLVLWTLDKKLKKLSENFGASYT